MTQTEKIYNVALVGGTHGNEMTGITLIRKFLQNPTLVARNSFKTHLFLGNPKAIQAVTRYVDEDLNRCFNRTSLAPTATYEQERAQGLIDEFESNNIDCIFDVHSTTSNAGLSIILVGNSTFNLYLAKYLSAKIPGLKVCSFYEEGKSSSFLNSLSPNGLAVEVGPVAQGVLDYSLFQKTESLVGAILDFIDTWNAGTTNEQGSLTLYKKLLPVFFPNDTAFVHPAVKDFVLLKNGDPMFVSFDGEVISSYLEDQDNEVFPYLLGESAYRAGKLAFYLMSKVEVQV